MAADILQAENDLAALYSLFDSAGLLDTLKNDKLTLFAPNSAALDKLGDGLLDKLFADQALLQNVLFGHIVPGIDVSSADLICGGGNFDFLFMANSIQTEITCETIPDGPTLTYIAEENQADKAKIVSGEQGDIVACNGIVHIIDGVIMADTDTQSPTEAPAATPTEAPEATPTVAPTPYSCEFLVGTCRPCVEK